MKSLLQNKKRSSQLPAEKWVITAPGWKRSYLGARLEKVPPQRPVEKGYP